MAGSDKPDIQAFLTSLKHKLRRRILRVMVNGEPISPCELSGLLGQPLSNVSYHVRVLAECGLIEVVEERLVRGATKHLYRWAVDAEWVKKLLEEEEEEPGDGA
jgi:DNA-binding transcriptional ArsR family regulator